jgi:hypothetical protein
MVLASERHRGFAKVKSMNVAKLTCQSPGT